MVVMVVGSGGGQGQIQAWAERAAAPPAIDQE